MLTILHWVVFHAIIVAMLAVDLGLLQRKAHSPSMREAASWSIVWILAAALFAVYVNFQIGSTASVDFATAYVIEKSLSVDNLFVFAVIFRYFGVPPAFQHKVLFWGIIGAIITRATFIFAGVQLLEMFDWMVYVFGAILIYSGMKLLRSHGRAGDPEKNFLVRWARRILPVTPSFQGDRFFVKAGRQISVTPLFLTLLAVESTDIVFAIDSVPAVLAITTNLFIAYTSNIFAILGLRALYFLLIQLLVRVRYLYVGLAVLLAYLGAKFIGASFVKIPTIISLLIIALILITTVTASIMRREQPGHMSGEGGTIESAS
ncbi:MAG TPA: TerC/Alx family metal homeostasis membrane protein [Candidatus Bathyarchaeia archaeon]|nr:TerC/Alx family metal homeostasis membrane protein [Candidatus Bathyarchaeia archaeon]